MVDWDKAVVGPVVKVFGGDDTFTYMPQLGQPFDIIGVFDKAYAPLSLADGMPVSIASPVLGVQLSQFKVYPEQGDRLERLSSGQIYVVREVQDDSHGAGKLLLNEGL